MHSAVLISEALSNILDVSSISVFLVTFLVSNNECFELCLSDCPTVGGRFLVCSVHNTLSDNWRNLNVKQIYKVHTRTSSTLGIWHCKYFSEWHKSIGSGHCLCMCCSCWVTQVRCEFRLQYVCVMQGMRVGEGNKVIPELIWQSKSPLWE